MLTTISKTKMVTLLALLGFCTALFSFSTPFGGEGFQVYLNDKVVLQRFGNEMNAIKTLKLDKVSENDELSIVYHHCGKVGKNRTITIKDGQNKIVKQWNFKDVADAGNRMTCKVKDIIGVQKASNELKLFYSSSELPGGRQLVSLSLPAGHLASR